METWQKLDAVLNGPLKKILEEQKKNGGFKG